MAFDLRDKCLKALNWVADDLKKDFEYMEEQRLPKAEIDQQLPNKIRLTKQDIPALMRQLGYKQTNHYYVKKRP